MKKKIAMLLLITVCAAVSIFGLSACANDTNDGTEGLLYVYNFATKSYAAVGVGSAKDTDIRIASTYRGRPVTHIGSRFHGNERITSVVIPDTVTELSHGAFEDCINLRSVEIGNSVTEIDAYAFARCAGLTSVKMGSSVKTIESDAFSGCSSLTDIEFPDSLEWIQSRAFENCSSLEIVKLSDSVTYVSESVFEKCTSLKSVEIGNSLRQINNGIFRYCSSLENVTIGSSVESIFGGAFYNCVSLKRIELPDSVTYVDDTSFEGCDSLEYNAYEGAQYLGNSENPYAVLMKVTDTEAEGITIHGKTRVIATSALRRLSGLTELILPPSVTHTGMYAFAGCSSLKSITLSENFMRIGHSAFSGCKSLEVINYGGTVDMWNHISKGIKWNSDTGEYVVQCKDGVLSKSESEEVIQ